jgi:hypothetical protein
MRSPELVALDLLRPDLPAKLVGAIERGLAPDPERRDLTAEEMAFVLRGLVEAAAGRLRLLDRIRVLRRDDARDGRANAPTRQDTRPSLFEESTPRVDGSDTLPLVSRHALERDFEDEVRPHPHTSMTVPTSPRRHVALPGQHAIGSRTSGKIVFESTRAPAGQANDVERPPRRAGVVLALGAAALVSGALIFGGLVLRQRWRSQPESLYGEGGSSDTAAPPPSADVTAIARPPSSPAPSATPAPSPSTSPSSPVPAPAATTGVVVTDPRDAGHRLFIDGRFAGAAGAPVTYPCGVHEVRVGSLGRPHKVLIPCGGEVLVTR